MCYYFYMNKDVIYIEPEDDITDIITKIENSKEKIIALVPPKKAGVFRSAVNIKLMSKASKAAEKTVVLVTVDPSIVRLAAAVRIPVTKNLQTAPVIPTVDTEIEETTQEEIIDDPDEAIEEEIKKTTEADEHKKSDDERQDKEEDDDDLPVKAKGKKEKKSNKGATDAADKSGNPVINWIKAHKKTTIFGCIGVIALTVALVWAFTIAPAVDIAVGISTEPNNFAEMITFTTNMAEENIGEGKFFLEEKKLESVAEVNFEATGQKNNGEKATGEVIVYSFFKKEGTIAINAGSTFTINGLSYTSNKDAALTWNGEDFKNCDNKNNATQITNSGCQVSTSVTVTATSAGTKYNIAPSNSGWSTTANVSVYSDKSMSGGTDDIIKVVEQADIEKAKNELKSANGDENKAKLISSIDGEALVLENSFDQETSAAVATPAAGEEVKDGVTPTLKATTTAVVYAVDKSKLQEYITEKAKLEDDQKVYEVKDPYIENFVKGDTGYAGKLKAVYAVGPKVTDNDVLEMVKGKGIGDARHDLSSINGITSVTITPSYPWVSVVPSDTNKITIKMEVKNNSDKEGK